MGRLIILLGQRVRSGTNFVGSTVAEHPDLVTLPVSISLGEFNLFYSDAIKTSVYKKVTKRSFGMKFTADDEIRFLQNYGEAWMKLLIAKYKIPSEKTIFIKSPSVVNLNLWRMAFPDAPIAVICRDGRDNVISSVRASNDKRSWHNMGLKLKKKINYYSGRSFMGHTRQWSDTAKAVLEIVEQQNLKVFRYEQLINSPQGITSLLAHYKLRVNDQILEKCLGAPVVGSSFGVATNKHIKPNWQPDYDKSKYNFTNKWKGWNFLKRQAFKSIAGKELIKLGYENHHSW